MQQPKKKMVTKEVAEKKRDSLDYEARLKATSARQAKNFDTSQKLMNSASKDYDQARKWDENIKKALKNKKS